MLAEDMRLLGQRQGLSYAYQSQQHGFNVFINFSLPSSHGGVPEVAQMNAHWVLTAGGVQASVGFPRWLSGKESACQCRRCRRCGLDP